MGINIMTMEPDITTTTESRNNVALLRLMTWLSPAFPVGSFSYSHGLERAVHDGRLTDRDDLQGWVAMLLASGSGWNDAVLFAESWRKAKAGATPSEVAELAEALAGSAERQMETMLQGTAFLEAAGQWPHPVLDDLPPDCPYCVAVGAAAGAHGVPLESALCAYLQAFASNLVQAGIRLGVLGQTGAVSVIAALDRIILETATRAARSSLDDLGSCTIRAEIASMNHEIQYSRLFRS